MPELTALVGLVGSSQSVISLVDRFVSGIDPLLVMTMKTNSSVLFSLTCAAFLLACGDDPIAESPSAGQGGAAGNAGQAGTSAGGSAQAGNAGVAGSGALGGSAGQSGSAGAGGASGQGGAGQGGASGQGGAGQAGASGQGGAGAGGMAGTSGNAGVAGASGEGGSAGAGGAGAGGSAGAAGTAGAAGCNPAEPPAEGAVFVSSSGSDAAGDGSQQKPFQSISKALTIDSKTILVAPGTYTGSISLPPDTTIQGGWIVLEEQWQRDCSAAARSKVIVTSTTLSMPVVTVDGSKGAKLQTLTVKTKDQGEYMLDKSGESLIGVLVKGDGAAVNLDDIEIISGVAANGGLAPSGVKGETIACDGKTDCGDGKSGEPGNNAEPVASSGAFGPDGYSPVDGNPGEPGLPGKNGLKGGDPQSVLCSKCDAADAASCPLSLTTFSQSSDGGTCGCGASGGEEGKPGRGGGASVGLLLIGNVSASLNGGQISSNNGGDGSSGSDGQEGGEGTSGFTGQDAEVCKVEKGGSSCQWSSGTNQCLLVGGGQDQAKGGMAGGLGGNGGKGGKGGGGTGGPSFAVVKVGEAKYIAEGVTLLHGDGGKGADGAPEGKAEDIGSF